MALSLADISQAAIGFTSLFGGFLTKIAPPEGVAIVWTGVAALMAGFAILAVKLLAHITGNSPSARFWGFFALAMIGTSVVLVLSYIASLQTRTVLYGGERRIIGTEYTAQAQAHLALHPNLPRADMLFNFAGDAERVWTPSSLKRARLILEIEYSLFIACLAFALNLGVEVLNNTWKMPPNEPTFTERVSKLKDIHFETDRSDLSQDAAEKLAEDATILLDLFRRYPKATMIIEGFCDDRGSFEYNLTLGYKRGEVTQDELVHAGLAKKKAQVVSHGKSSPMCGEDTEQCRGRNRRVHLTVVE